MKYGTNVLLIPNVIENHFNSVLGVFLVLLMRLRNVNGTRKLNEWQKFN